MFANFYKYEIRQAKLDDVKAAVEKDGEARVRVDYPAFTGKDDEIGQKAVIGTVSNSGIFSNPSYIKIETDDKKHMEFPVDGINDLHLLPAKPIKF